MKSFELHRVLEEHYKKSVKSGKTEFGIYFVLYEESSILSKDFILAPNGNVQGICEDNGNEGDDEFTNTILNILKLSKL